MSQEDDDYKDRPLTRTAAANAPNWSGSMYPRDSTGKVLPISSNYGGYHHRRVSRRRVVSRRSVSRRRGSRRRGSHRRHRK